MSVRMGPVIKQMCLNLGALV